MDPPSSLNSPPACDSRPREDLDLYDGEEPNDPEVQRLQDELKRLRKERTLLQLRSEIAHEQQLINEARQRLLEAQSRSSAVESPRADPTQSAGAKTIAEPASAQPNSPLPVDTKPANRQSPPVPAPSTPRPNASESATNEPSHTPRSVPAQPTVRSVNGHSPPALTQSTPQPAASERGTNEQSHTPHSAPAQQTARSMNGQSHSPTQEQAALIQPTPRPTNGQLPMIKQPGRDPTTTPDDNAQTGSAAGDEFKSNVIKRENSGDNTSQNMPTPVAPPALTIGQPFEGKDRQEFHIFMTHLQRYFQGHEEYFQPDYRKLREANRHLTDDLRDRWADRRRSRADPPMWEEFCEFLHSQVRSKMPAQLALDRYMTARQRTHQTVKDFSGYLRHLEPEVDQLVTDQMRFARLNEGVFAVVQNVAGPLLPGMGYDDYVLLLYNAEIRIPSRAGCLGRKRPQKRRRVG